MKNMAIFMAMLSVFLWLGFGYCGENIYTWKDRDGVLNITDHAPPSGAEIIDISPSYREKTEELWHQRRIRQQEIAESEQRRLREQQAEAERKEAASRKRAEQQLMEQKGKVKADDKPKRKKGY
mgnify:CR=1 FL=1